MTHCQTEQLEICRSLLTLVVIKLTCWVSKSQVLSGSQYPTSNCMEESGLVYESSYKKTLIDNDDTKQQCCIISSGKMQNDEL